MHGLTVAVAHAHACHARARLRNEVRAGPAGQVRDPRRQRLRCHAVHVSWRVARCVATRSDVAERMSLFATHHCAVNARRCICMVVWIVTAV